MWEEERNGHFDAAKDSVTYVRISYLNTGLPEVDAESICVPPVVLNQLLQSAKCRSSGNEETTLIQLSDPVMLDGVTISY